MPIYEYACPTCGHNFEKLQRIGASAPICPECGSDETDRKVSLSAFHLKGGGLYATDYKPQSSSGTDDTGSSGGGHSCGSGCGCAH